MTTEDPRIQTDEPYEPAFQAGAFHIEVYITGQGWGIYDAYENRSRLVFATATEAIDACIALANAADESNEELDAEYARQLPKARASLADIA